MTFFPHLVAGPIVRAKDFLPQISNATLPNTSQCSWALLRICRGLAKKLILADFLGQWVDMVHLMPEGYSGFETTIAVYAYAFALFTASALFILHALAAMAIQCPPGVIFLS